MGLRIIAGEFGGRRLLTPSGPETRPTSDRVREALFSILGSVEGVHVLDVYAGSGALGLEALSRGATPATFVEQSRTAMTTLQKNLALIQKNLGKLNKLEASGFIEELFEKYPGRRNGNGQQSQRSGYAIR